jgi:hypothetical protein
MSRQGLVLGSAAAAVWLGSSTSLVALADDKKKEKDATAHYFDPEALERGAKALREINASPHAKQASQQAVNSRFVVAWHSMLAARLVTDPEKRICCRLLTLPGSRRSPSRLNPKPRKLSTGHKQQHKQR